MWRCIAACKQYWSTKRNNTCPQDFFLWDWGERNQNDTCWRWRRSSPVDGWWTFLLIFLTIYFVAYKMLNGLCYGCPCHIILNESMGLRLWMAPHTVVITYMLLGAGEIKVAHPPRPIRLWAIKSASESESWPTLKLVLTKDLKWHESLKSLNDWL